MKKFFKKLLGFVKRNLTILIILFIFLFLFVCDNTSLHAGSLIMNNLKAIATSFTPTTDLFDDGSEVSFVSFSFFGLNSIKQEEKVEFYKPSKLTPTSSEEYLVYSFDGVLSSVAKGRVSAVGYTKDNEKYIEIEHTKGYVSRYIGVQNVGVATGERINAKNPVAMINQKQSVKVIIQQNGNLIRPSEIEWKN